MSQHDLRSSPGALEACMAFGAASLAVTELADEPSLPAGDDRLAELEAAHDQLRRLFALGARAAVCELALSIMVLAEATTMGSSE